MDEDEQIISVPFDEEDLEDEYANYRTYHIDIEHKRISGFTDGAEACQQAIWKAMQTTRFAYLLYDDQYGSELFTKLHDGDLTPEYLDSDVPAVIEDALMADDRVTGIKDFTYELINGDSVHCAFTVTTIYGDMDMEGVITDDQ